MTRQHRSYRRSSGQSYSRHSSSSGDRSGGSWGSAADERQEHAQSLCETCNGTGRAYKTIYHLEVRTCTRCRGDSAYRETRIVLCTNCRGRRCESCRWWGEREMQFPCSECQGQLWVEDSVPETVLGACECLDKDF